MKYWIGAFLFGLSIQLIFSGCGHVAAGSMGAVTWTGCVDQVENGWAVLETDVDEYSVVPAQHGMKEGVCR